ncbi:site-specific DNA-methyltransferase [Candidatus Saccharibacteria bacterium oral taxon 955]|jgi:DNA (cytosine-5-)-methyltransferase
MNDTKKISTKFSIDNDVTLYNGDCLKLLKSMPDGVVDLVVTSPPYCMGKSYEDPKDDLRTFFDKHTELLPEIFRVLKEGGSMCWQVGYHVKNNVVTPLDYMVHEVIKHHLDKTIAENLVLRNRVVWTFGHGYNASQRFSGRHEVIMWYTKGKDYNFDLDSVRVPQKYPGKKYYKGDKKGQFSGNPLGKNPSDVWDIPNVKAHHVEKTEHPCQFPIAIPQRLIKALSPKNGLVLDPFFGSGASAVAAALEGRRFVGSDTEKSYCDIAKARTEQAFAGTIVYREDKPVYEPDPKQAVARRPEHFASVNGKEEKTVTNS